MTTTKLVQAEIKRFLTSVTPEVLSISGKWGIGKTFTWQQLLDEFTDNKKIALSQYAYVSLFGLNSLDDLKISIFENTEILITPAEGAVNQAKKIGSHLLSYARKSRSVSAEAPVIGKVIKSANSLFFASVRNQIVCIDDLERSGKGLRVQDVLGLTSFLKEQRKCKVVLLLNRDALGDEGAEFSKHLEKVIDVELKFSPTAADSVKIALSRKDKVDQLLSENCLTLGISNIRVIKKIERLVRIIEPMLTKHDPKVLYQAAHTLTLFGWARYESDGTPKNPPTLDFLRRLTGYDSRKPEEIPENEAIWKTILDDYEFRATDEFDLALAEGIENGFFDPTKIRENAKQLNKKIALQNKDSSFEQAWQLYHDSFDDNQEQVLDAIYTAFKNNVESITTTNFNGTVSLLKELGRTEQAEELIKLYVDNRSDDREFWNLEENPFGDSVTDPDVRTAINSKFASFSVTAGDPIDILLKIGSRKGWHDQDIATLSNLSVDDYYKILKHHEGTKLIKIIKAALSFERISNASNQMLEISKRAKEALRRVGKESPINARRVSKFGIQVS